MELRDYQQEIISLVRNAMRRYKRILVCCPTGGGKTAMAAHILDGAYKKQNSANFCVHRRQLIEQVSKELIKQSIPHGFIVSGYEATEAYIKIAMQQTYVRRNNESVTLLVIDEAHLNCDTYSKIMENNPDAFVILLSATPERLDGKAIPAEVKIETVDTAELIERGYLSPFKYYAPTQLDFSKVSSLGGDYIPKEVGLIAEKANIIGSAVAHYKTHGEDGKFINFSYSIKHSQDTAEAFTEAGYPCVHLDAESSDEERAEAFRQLVAGDIRGISNVNLFAEGADCPALRVMIGQSPTKSMMRFRQRIGRVLRPEQAKEYAIVLDMVNDYKRHGFPTDKYEWQWQGRKKGTREGGQKENLSPLTTCNICFTVNKDSVSHCAGCGAELPSSPRQIQEKAGELAEIKQHEAEKQKWVKKLSKWEAIRQAKSPDDLINWAVKNGHKRGYGFHLWRLKANAK